MAIEHPQLRIFEPERDYPIVSAWWAGHGFPAIPAGFLPKLGVVASYSDKDAAAAWLYMDNSVGVCMLEWLVTNPANAPRESYRAVTAVTEFLESEAQRMDYAVMLTAANQESLCRFHEKRGFQKTDGGMTHFVKRITP